MGISSDRRAAQSVEPRDDQGFALLISLIVLALFCLIGFYLAVNAATEIRISDNYESEIKARYAAYAGLDHARAALKGLGLNDILQGPDGRHDESPGYLAHARSFAFRNPVSWTAARTLDVFDPAAEVGGLADDGLLSTGRYMAETGVVLIPASGIALSAPNPAAAGSVTAARYFVKVTDNSGDTSERAADPADDPFVDGDGLIIVRSFGIAPAIREHAGGSARNNSVVVLESRLQRRSTLDLDAPLVIHGTDVLPSTGLMFEGEWFSVRGGAGNPAIGTIDADRFDMVDLTARIAARLAPGQEARIQGEGASPSIRDLTAAIAASGAKAPLLNGNYLWELVHHRAEKYADSSFHGNQDWTVGAVPDLGYYDPSLPSNATEQRPRVTFVGGDLAIGGGTSGGGLLIVTGRLSVNGPFSFTGLVLVAGSGALDTSGPAWSFTGGVYVAAIASDGGSMSWGAARLTLGGSGVLALDRAAIRMAIALIPPDQVGFREVTSSLDP